MSLTFLSLEALLLISDLTLDNCYRSVTSGFSCRTAAKSVIFCPENTEFKQTF